MLGIARDPHPLALSHGEREIEGVTIIFYV
jgi:hypothetical protein